MPRPALMTITRALAAVALVALAAGCAQPAERPEAADQDPNHVYKPDMKAEVVPIPAAVAAALPGLLNDNIYLYLEIAPTVNLVAYTPGYTREGAVRMCAEAFVALAESAEPRLRDRIEFWIIQVQPTPGAADAPADAGKAGEERPAGEVVVWGVRPSEADAYKQDRDLAKFLSTSEYLLVDDQIIPAGPERMKPFPGITPAPAPAPAPPEPEKISPTPPAPGATVTPPAPGGTVTPPAPGGTAQPVPGTTAQPAPGGTSEPAPAPEAPGSTVAPQNEPSSDPPLLAPGDGTSAQP